jgi:hypothetical protein
MLSLNLGIFGFSGLNAPVRYAAQEHQINTLESFITAILGGASASSEGSGGSTTVRSFAWSLCASYPSAVG